MDGEFWQERWRDGRIGFHQAVHNAQMLDHWPKLGLAEGSSVFVPLAGKSMDMLWLAAQGHKVLGIELSSVAVEAFFAENDLEAEVETGPDFKTFRSYNIELLCGDFFALEPEDLASVDAVYDRAALIALPPEMREQYAAHMIACLPPGAEMMLVTLDYPQSEMAGPPFAVSEAEVVKYYAADFDLERVGCVSLDAEGRPPAGRDLSEMYENTYHLKSRKN